MQHTNSEVPDQITGIDISDKESTVVTLGKNGQIIEERKIPTTIAGFRCLLGGQPPRRVVIEVCTHALWISREIKSLGHEVVVANPRQVKLISQSKKKTDRNDARILAKVGRLDEELLAPVWMRTERCVAARTLMRARKMLVGTRTRLINLVRTECSTRRW